MDVDDRQDLLNAATGDVMELPPDDNILGDVSGLPDIYALVPVSPAHSSSGMSHGGAAHMHNSDPLLMTPRSTHKELDGSRSLSLGEASSRASCIVHNITWVRNEITRLFSSVVVSSNG